MKKQYSLLLLPLLLSSCANGFLANDKSNVIEGDIDLSILPTLKDEILEDHRYISDITSALYGSYKTIIESSDTRYYSELYVENKLVSFESHQKGLEGELLNESLNVDNTVYSETLVEDNVTLLYKDYHQTLFQNFKSISDNDLDKYFTPYKVEDKYYVTLTTFGEGLLFSTLDIFFKDIDSYIWDKETLKYTYKEVVFTFDKDVNLTNICFLKHKSDKYGGYREYFDITVEDITSSIGLKPVEGKLSATQEANFNSLLSRLYDDLKNGNFTHNINIIGSPYQYSNFYDFSSNKEDFPNMMLSNLLLNDASNGATYLSIVEENTGNFRPYAFSPYTENYSSVTDFTWDKVTNLIPRLDKISPNFFNEQYSISGTTYRFDIANFAFANYTFCTNLLTCLYGGFDPVVIYGGFYVNYGIYDYTFNYLDIHVDKFGAISYTLNFENENGIYNSEASFSKINTTNLESEPTLKDGVDYIKAVYNGGN